MISVIVCHRDADLLTQFTKNLSETIGVPYELIVIDNRENAYNIFQAYNEGVKRSRYDLLCFAHEDLLFHSKDWGGRVVDHFESPDVGMIGVVGGNVFPKCPSQWWNSSYLNDHLINLIQHWNSDYTKHIGHPSKRPIHDGDWSVTRDLSNPTGDVRAPAVALDGLWMCAHRRVFEHCEFDESTFHGFHCYDSDICFQIGRDYKIYVVYDILMEHLSMGTVAKDWAEAALILARKWKSELPALAESVNSVSVSKHQAKCLLSYCYWVQSKGFDDGRIRGIIEEFLVMDEGWFASRERLLLCLWSKFGYRFGRFPYALCKHFCK